MRHACSALCNEGGVQAVGCGMLGQWLQRLWGPAPGETGVPSDGTPVSAGWHGGQACERKKPHEDLHQAPAAAAQSAIAIRASDFSDQSAVSACAGCTHAMQLCCKALVALHAKLPAQGARCRAAGGRFRSGSPGGAHLAMEHCPPGTWPQEGRQHIKCTTLNAFPGLSIEPRYREGRHPKSSPASQRQRKWTCASLLRAPPLSAQDVVPGRRLSVPLLSWLRCRCYWGNRASDQCYRLQRHGTMRGNLRGRQQLTTGHRLQRHTRKTSMPVQSGAA